MTGSVVVDASLAVKWLLRELDSNRADALLVSWEQANIRVVGPHLLPAEVANAVYQRVVRGEVSLDAALRLLARLLATRIQLIDPDSLQLRAMEMAAQLQQNAVYDAHYLALAEMLHCELWTADERFYRGANPQFPLVRWLGEV